MKNKKPASKKIWISFSFLFWLAFVGSLSVIFWPDLSLKNKFQKSDKTITFLMDWMDVQIESEKTKRPLPKILSQLKETPVHVVAAPLSLSLRHEKMIRSHEMAILWRGNVKKDQSKLAILNRMKPGDGVLSFGEKAYGFPRQLNSVANAVIFLKGFYPIVEFASQKGGRFLIKMTHPFVVKTHCLQAKESIGNKKNLWKPRLIRAVEDRWVRMLYIQLGSGLNFQQWMEFLTLVKDDLHQKGYVFGRPKPFSIWTSRFNIPAKDRLLLVFFIGLVAPIFSLLLIRLLKWKSPLFLFLAMTGVTILAGVAIHSIGSTPESVLGLSQMRGTKLLLVFPLFGSIALMISKKEWESVLNAKILVWHLLVGGLFLVGFLGVYLMRSGNFPLLPVLDVERVFRDFLDQLFGVRPRFKEFLIGHPLLLLGLYIKSQTRQSANFFKDGRLWICLGVVGQISILNTFVHFHSPFQEALLRTTHGVWLGFLLSIPICLVWSKK